MREVEEVDHIGSYGRSDMVLRGSLGMGSQGLIQALTELRLPEAKTQFFKSKNKKS